MKRANNAFLIQSIYINPSFAKILALSMPEWDIDINKTDTKGEYSESFNFDIDFNYNDFILTIIGEVKVYGTFRKLLSETHLQPAEYKITKKGEIINICFFIDERIVEVTNEKEFIIKVNKFL